ncbi:MAG: hypothetical protein L6R41_006025 [Letrouitia leprolyta]|nr:MAG: hypothetical protein L6R41_006025 [Letrouitia leprolyta]
MTLYFGYGSNLWLEQMSLRCPSSAYVGIARIKGYHWIIDARGYANIVETPGNPSSEVFGHVYRLTSADEVKLDKNEGTHLVPPAYTTERMEAEVWIFHSQEGLMDVEDVGQSGSGKRELFVYIDRMRATGGTPKEEYVERMNMGIADALKKGVPKRYITEVLRRYIPENST